MTFSEWLEKTLQERGWSHAELSRRGGPSSGGMSMVINGQRSPGIKFCQRVAKALDMPADEVIRLASLIPPQESEKTGEDRLIFTYRQLPPIQREELQQIAHAMRIIQENLAPYSPEPPKTGENLGDS